MAIGNYRQFDTFEDNTPNSDRIRIQKTVFDKGYEVILDNPIPGEKFQG